MVEVEEKKSTLNEKQKNLLDRVKNKAHLIGHLVGFNKLNELHAEWISKFWKKRRTTYVLKAHRGSYKSTAITLFIALIVVFRPNETVIFLRKTDNDVKEIISNVSKILKSDVFQAFSQIMYGHGYRLTKDTAFEVSTTLKTGLGGGSQVLGIGIKGSLTGKHADWIIVDDIANRKDKYSMAEREFTKDVWRELQNVKNPEGRSIAIGTVWHPDDVFSLMPKADIYTCYDTGLLTNDQIEEIKGNMPPALFSANYELKFIADEDAIFTDYRTLYDKDLDNGLTGAELIKDGVCHVDAGYYGGDTTAFTVLKKLADGRYLVFGKMWKRHVQACMGDILKLKEKYRAGSLYLETNGDKGYLAKEFREQGVRCITYHEKRNKFEKITNVLSPNVWAKVYFIEDTDENYINQIMDYNETADHDDCCDSLSSIIYRSESFKGKAIEGLQI